MDIRTRQQVLDLIVGWWREQFNLIGATDIAEMPDLKPNAVLEAVKSLAAEGEVQIVTGADSPAPNPGRPDSAEFQRTYVKPTPRVLAEWLKREGQTYSPYRTRLMLGEDQAAMLTFQPAVLDAYRDHLEVEVRDDLIVTRIDVVKRGTDRPVYVRYRMVNSSDAHPYVTVNLWDLSELHPDEQRQWETHELQAAPGS